MKQGNLEESGPGLDSQSPACISRRAAKYNKDLLLFPISVLVMALFPRQRTFVGMNLVGRCIVGLCGFESGVKIGGSKPMCL